MPGLRGLSIVYYPLLLVSATGFLLTLLAVKTYLKSISQLILILLPYFLAYLLPSSTAYPLPEVVNAGISGSTTSGGVSRIQWLLKSKPDLLIVALGANDGLRGVSVSEIKKNLKEIILAARKNDIVTLLAGMKMPPNYGTKYTDDFSQVFQELANEQEVPLIPFLLEGVGGEPSMNLPDGIHPNPTGHDKIAQTVYDHVIKLLPQS